MFVFAGKAKSNPIGIVSILLWETITQENNKLTIMFNATWLQILINIYRELKLETNG